MSARRTRPARWAGALLALWGAAALIAAPAQAQTDVSAEAVSQAATVSFDIPAQDLGEALADFARQSGQEMLYAPSTVAGKTSTAINGRLSRPEAMGQLLEGTGLLFEIHESGSMIIGDEAGIAAYRERMLTSDASAAVQATPPTATPAPIADIDSARRAGVEEIIVTGQKKAERLQDVPIAISAFSMETLDAQKIEGGFDLLKAVPNVTFSKTNFSGYNFQIRGIGTQAISATTDPGVAVSFNNTTLIVNRLFEQEYLDIERVEVLRGPQGTLFGRNATAGVINVISAKPVIGEALGEVKLETGNFNAQRIRGHYNLPLGDTVALRAAYASTVRDGYGYNEYSEVENDFRPRVQSDVDDRDLWTGRLTLGWEPNDRLRVNLLWERFEEDDRRVRTSKQLCTRDTGQVFDLHDGSQTDPVQYGYSFYSQGCKGGSLYDAAAFGTPNGASLPYLSAFYWGTALSGLAELIGAREARGLGGSPYYSAPGVPGFPEGCDPDLDPFSGGCFIDPVPERQALIDPKCDLTASSSQISLYPVDLCNPDVFRGRSQSHDLRTISSQLEPQYHASSDVYELSFDYQLSDDLLFAWQTVYARDEYYATQDYNRFTAFPIWEDSSAACDYSIGGSGVDEPDCSSVGTFADGYYTDLSPRPEGTPLGTPGVLCDPQLGCSDTLLIQDLSRAESTQFNQEIRLVSSFASDINFSLGANYTNFETLNDYFVFSNAFTHLLNFFPFQYHNSACAIHDTFCRYVDPHTLDEIIAGEGGDGHNYFRNGNPYKLRSAALFGELYWQATERLKLTAGLRFTWDRKVFTPVPSQLLLGDYRQAGISGAQVGVPYDPFVPEGGGPHLCVEIHTTCPLSGTAPDGRGYPAEPDIVQEWRVPTGRVVLDYKPDPRFDWQDETMVYLSLARGYKGGGANPPSVAEPQARFFSQASGGFVVPATFDPEYVNAVEIGSKNTLFGGALNLNLSAFYYDYADYQISKIVDRTAVNENFDATVWGLELESLIAPTPDTLFNLTVGYLRTRVADGEASIDLMDRTDGGRRHFAPDPEATGSNGRTTDFPDGFDDWIVLGPDIKSASNCIAPRELIEAEYQVPGRTPAAGQYCPNGNLAGGKAANGTSYFDENGNVIPGNANFSLRKFYDPAKDAPNGSQGFAKDLSGNELPNAPRMTVSLGAQQTWYLPASWDLTGRVDWYWQDRSYARVYNYAPYDRLRAWTNTNFSVWLNQPQWGLRIEAYLKNAFDETPITGTFLNSDDSGLTTNVFTLDPRLVGLSITKTF
jgi:iron complex outermembrane recepter protein